MSVLDVSEKWQIEVGGTVYEADFEELPSWVSEGSLLPTDKVRKGNLRWIEASKVPTIAALFKDTRPKFEPPATTKTGTIQRQPESPREYKKSCKLHPSIAAYYSCPGCAVDFCGDCPRSYGGSVKICPECGAMCRKLSEATAAAAADERRAAALREGFGFNDFARAVKLPFQHRTSLIFGSAMFALFSLGQAASLMGGPEMVLSSLFCLMLANMLTFGVLANTVDAFALGETDSNFMPSFEDFSIWDDIVHPFVLSAGVYLSSFGAFFLVFCIGLYIVSSSVDSRMSGFQAELERIPGTQFYTAKDTVKQSDEVRDVLADTQRQNEARLRLQEQIASGSVPDGLEKKVTNSADAPGSLPANDNALSDSSIAESSASRELAKHETVQSTLGLPPVLVVVGSVALLWALFYFPAACAVAAFTKTFSSAVDPLVGLDTIKRFGFTYAKVLAMSLLLLLTYVSVRSVSTIVFAPLDLPIFGNLPAKFVSGLVGFYLWTVFAYVIGAALYKSSDRLQISR